MFSFRIIKFMEEYQRLSKVTKKRKEQQGHIKSFQKDKTNKDNYFKVLLTGFFLDTCNCDPYSQSSKRLFQY